MNTNDPERERKSKLVVRDSAGATERFDTSLGAFCREICGRIVFNERWKVWRLEREDEQGRKCLATARLFEFEMGSIETRVLSILLADGVAT